MPTPSDRHTPAKTPDRLTATFDNDGAKFHISNAIWLARLSDLVYTQDEATVKAQSKAWGLKLVKWSWVNQGLTHVGLWSDDQRIFVVFRGANEFADMRDNTAIGRLRHDWGRVHAGFNRAVKRVEYELLTTVAEVKNEKKDLWLAGHSLGGALAVLMAAKFLMANQPVCGVYTYGQPQVGNGAFKKNYNRELEDRTYRVVNHEDLVPQSLKGFYRHAGTLIQLGEKSGYRIGGPNRPDRSSSPPPRRSGSKLPRRASRSRAMSLPDHKIANYLKKLTAIADDQDA